MCFGQQFSFSWFSQYMWILKYIFVLLCWCLVVGLQVCCWICIAGFSLSLSLSLSLPTELSGKPLLPLHQKVTASSLFHSFLFCFVLIKCDWVLHKIKCCVIVHTRCCLVPMTTRAIWGLQSNNQQFFCFSSPHFSSLTACSQDCKLHPPPISHQRAPPGSVFIKHHLVQFSSSTTWFYFHQQLPAHCCLVLRWAVAGYSLKSQSCGCHCEACWWRFGTEW